MRYSYSGPAYIFNNYVGEFNIETVASTIKEAKRNILGQIKKKLGLEYTSYVRINCDLIYECAEDGLTDDDFEIEESSVKRELYTSINGVYYMIGDSGQLELATDDDYKSYISSDEEEE